MAWSLSTRCAFLALAFTLAFPLPGLTQEGGADPEQEVGSEAARIDSEWWRGAWGDAEPNRLYTGLWTLHLYRRHDGLSPHHLVGLSWRGAVGTTFVNSHGGRSWGVGVGRTVAAFDRRDAGAAFGYRVGIIRGYDERLHEVAGRWPGVPAAELTLGLRMRRVGAQVTWAGIVTSVGGFIELGRR